MKEVLYCERCGKLLRIHSEVYLHYRIRWWEGWHVALCDDCSKLVKDETQKDKPRRFRDEKRKGGSDK